MPRPMTADMAVTTVMDGLAPVAFASCMSKKRTTDRWLHRSVVRPDVAQAIDESAPLDDRSIRKTERECDGLRFIGSPEYGTTRIAHLRERNVQTEFRSGFGVRMPLTDSFLGYCRTERGEADKDHILFLIAIKNLVALTMRGSKLSLDEPPTIAASGSA